MPLLIGTLASESNTVSWKSSTPAAAAVAQHDALAARIEHADRRVTGPAVLDVDGDVDVLDHRSPRPLTVIDEVTVLGAPGLIGTEVSLANSVRMLTNS